MKTIFVERKMLAVPFEAFGLACALDEEACWRLAVGLLHSAPWAFGLAWVSWLLRNGFLQGVEWFNVILLGLLYDPLASSLDSPTATWA